MPNTIRFLATDLDGTLIGSANELPLYLTFNERVTSLREEQDAIWAACTGRTFRSFWEFFLPMRKFGVLPDYVVIRHAFIFRLTRLGFVPHLAWNVATMLRLWRETRAASEAMQGWHSTVTGGAIGVRTISRSSGRMVVRFDSEEAASVAEDLLTLRLAEHKHLQIRRDKTDVEVRIVPATKGTAIIELARHLNIEREHILTIGNGQNDLSMLNNDVAGRTGCPSNSTYDVMKAVNRCGGHIASQRSLSGVLEIIDAHLFGTVQSEMPPVSPQPSGSVLGNSTRTSRSHARRRSKKSNFIILALVLYATLLAFATFDVIPHGDLIMKPLNLLNAFLVKMTSMF